MNRTLSRTIRFVIVILGTAASVTVPASIGSEQPRKIPVIYDSDIGDDIDDTWALSLLLNSPELDVKLVVGDQGRTEYRTKLFAKLLEVANRTDIPIGVGIEVEREGAGGQTAWVADYDLTTYPGKIYEDGVNAIIETIMASPEPITLIAVGPLPNIREALRREPRIAHKARFVGMHGSVRKGYDGKPEIAAEYNVKADAKACQAALSAEWPVTITPLDTCGIVSLRGAKFARVRDCSRPLAKALVENYYLWAENTPWFAKYKDKVTQQSSTLFDTVAVYLAISQELCKMEKLPIRVTDDGKTLVDDAGKPMLVATDWHDLGRFEDFLVARLTGDPVSTQPTNSTTSTKEIAAEKQSVLDWLGNPDVVNRFGRISDKIWSYAELGLQEHKSSALLIETLRQAGFKVEKGLAGMPTCFVASYGSGKPVIGILAEYDALPMLSQKAGSHLQDPVVEGAPGHGCGHNTMGTASAAAAIAVSRAMKEHKLVGTVKVFGSPAEEMLVSRPYMIRAGLFDGVDAVINNHSSSEFGTDYGVRGSALYSVLYTFAGKTAHSAGGPWSGRSALDAVEIMNVATNYLREHLHYTHRMHYVIQNGGEAPNVVPDKASVWYFLRNTDERLPEMYERVLNCAKGAALATGTKLTQVRVFAAIHQSHHNQTLANIILDNIKLVGMPQWSDEEDDFAIMLQGELGNQPRGMPREISGMSRPISVFTGGASSDHGDVTLIAPTATIRFPGKVPGIRGHHWSTVACGFGSAAHKGLSAGAKAIAATAIDLLTRPEAVGAIQTEFKAYSKKHPYQSFLPKDAKPPLDINESLMNRYRPLMQRFYVEEKND